MGRGYLPPGHIHVVGSGSGQPGAPGERGPAGPPGEPGAPGPAAWRTPVAWAPEATYASQPPAHVVTYDGETYLCIEAHTSTNNFDPSKFIKLAARGAPAEPGTGSLIYIRNNGAVVDSAPGSDTTPVQFTFTDVTGAQLGTVYISNPVSVMGINVPSPISVTNGHYSINGGPFTATAGTVVNGDSVRVRVTSSGTNSTAVGATLTIGGVSDTFTVTTTAVAIDTTPNAFSFTDVANATLNTQYTSNQIIVSGINAPAPISVVGGQYSVNNGPYTATAGNVVNGDIVTVRTTSSGANNTSASVTLTIGGVSDTWTVTTAAAQSDTTPNPFSFTDTSGAAASTKIYSDIITVAGINAATAISLSGDGEYSINNGAWRQAAATVNNGDTVQLRVTAPSNAGASTNCILTIGGVSDTWTVTTAASADTTPNPFDFVNLTDATPETLVMSNIVTIQGINAPATVTFNGNDIPGAAYRKNGGAWATASTTVEAGDSLQLRMESDPLAATAVECSITVGGVTDTWRVTTAAGTGTPNPQPQPGVNMPTFENGPWKITMPYNAAKVLSKAGDAVEYWPNRTPDLKTIDDAYLDRQADGSIIFYAPTDGARTSGSSYARCELREIKADGSDEYEWRVDEGGRLEATCRVRGLPTLTKGDTNRCVVGQIHGPNDEPCRLYYWAGGKLSFYDDKAISGSITDEIEFVLKDASGNETRIPMDAYFTYVIEMDMSGIRVTAHYNGVKYTAFSPRSSFWTAGTPQYFKAGVYNAVGYPGQGKTNEGTGGSRVQFTRILNPQHPHTITSTSGNATG